MDNKIKVGIIGGAGYTGGELIRILLNHPNVSIVFVQSNSNADKPLHAVHQDLLGETNIFLQKKLIILLICFFYVWDMGIQKCF